MTRPRLNAAVEATAIVRKISAQGDFATVLRQGDSERGSLLLVVTCRGRHVTCLNRQLDLSSGSYRWNRLGPSESASSAEIRDFLGSQARLDPDLWLIELDIASPERFIAETTASG
ncbi:MAG: DUF1491 family protein [Sphingomicrobium sp.]